MSDAIPDLATRHTPHAITAPAGAAEVAEFQGLYGSYHVSELLLQKIWLRGAFDQTRARTTSGEPVVIVHPGSWNRLSGPDFRAARLVLGGREVTGDIEVHFHADAWKLHGHEADPAYGQVVLHVVLFPPPAGQAPARACDGRDIPSLVLVDLLWHDLEEYAIDEAVAALSGRDAVPLVERLLAMTPTERTAAIRAAAVVRWREKVRYAQVRVDRCGWEEACHLTTLEILGYRANREAMLRVGACHPWSAWVRSAGDGGPAIDALIAAGGDAWTSRGVRPANQPTGRLEQYRRWMARVPDWPVRLGAWTLPDVDVGGMEISAVHVAALRRRCGFAELRRRCAHELTGNQLGGLRFDTWVVNLVLPFLAVGGSAREERAAAWWRLWAPGDIPEVLLDAARRLNPPGAREARTNESVQGLLGIHLQRALSAGPLR